MRVHFEKKKNYRQIFVLKIFWYGYTVAREKMYLLFFLSKYFFFFFFFSTRVDYLNFIKNFERNLKCKNKKKKDARKWL